MPHATRRLAYYRHAVVLCRYIDAERRSRAQQITIDTVEKNPPGLTFTREDWHITRLDLFGDRGAVFDVTNHRGKTVYKDTRLEVTWKSGWKPETAEKDLLKLYGISG